MCWVQFVSFHSLSDFVDSGDLGDSVGTALDNEASDCELTGGNFIFCFNCIRKPSMSILCKIVLLFTKNLVCLM